MLKFCWDIDDMVHLKVLLSRVQERILMEHIEKKNSLEFQLSFQSKCSQRILHFPAVRFVFIIPGISDLPVKALENVSSFW